MSTIQSISDRCIAKGKAEMTTENADFALRKPRIPYFTDRFPRYRVFYLGLASTSRSRRQKSLEGTIHVGWNKCDRELL